MKIQNFSFWWTCPHCTTHQFVENYWGENVQSWTHKTVNSGTIQCKECCRQTAATITLVLDPIIKETK